MIFVVEQDDVIQRLELVGSIVLNLRIRRRRPRTHSNRVNLARPGRNRQKTKTPRSFIYRLRNLPLLLDSECFASRWFVSILQEELKWPMALGRVEPPRAGFYWRF